jgi:hypothetical protein
MHRVGDCVGHAQGDQEWPGPSTPASNRSVRSAARGVGSAPWRTPCWCARPFIIKNVMAWRSGLIDCQKRVPELDGSQGGALKTVFWHLSLSNDVREADVVVVVGKESDLQLQIACVARPSLNEDATWSRCYAWRCCRCHGQLTLIDAHVCHRLSTTRH